MHIPGVDTVGGFSITSSPMHLRRTGDIHLAVKNSESPPSMWVHTKVYKIKLISQKYNLMIKMIVV